MKCKDLSIYIHFPYCKSRCPYCDFFRGILPKKFDEQSFVSNYLNDIDFMKSKCDDFNIKSIFFGGGTPSLLSANSIGEILNKIGKNFRIDNNIEISIEANPNSYDKIKFEDFSKIGINRLSLGVQALNSDDLRFLGRTHSLKDAMEAIDSGKRLFDKFSIDLIYARPNQNFCEWKKELDMALAIGLDHISLYQLTLEEGTVFERKKIQMLDDDSAINMYNDTVKYLRENGFERYEVSNFAKNNYNICKHNMVYWQGGNYWGIGVGAHGRVVLNNKLYAQFDGVELEELTKKERAEELIIMGLRIKDGINKDNFYEACGLNLFEFLSLEKIDYLKKLELLVGDDDGIRLTDKGFGVMDKVILDLCS